MQYNNRQDAYQALDVYLTGKMSTHLALQEVEHYQDCGIQLWWTAGGNQDGFGLQAQTPVVMRHDPQTVAFQGP